ncbi:MAG: OsmC family protein [Vulcanibacillus sp.]
MSIQEFKATTTLKDGFFVEAEAREFKITMDEPKDLGGTNKAMNPVELLLCSLGGCLTISVSAFSKATKVDLTNCHVEVTGDLDPDGFLGKNNEVRVGLTQIRYNIEIESDSPQENIDRLIQMVEERCPISDTLTGVEIIGNVKVRETAR